MKLLTRGCIISLFLLKGLEYECEIRCLLYKHIWVDYKLINKPLFNSVTIASWLMTECHVTRYNCIIYTHTHTTHAATI